MPLSAGRAWFEKTTGRPYTERGHANLVAELTQRCRREVDEAREILAAVERHRTAWEAEFGSPYPRTIEDLLQWSARLDLPGRFLPAERVASGDWTLRDIMPLIEGYLLRLDDSHTTAAKLSPAELAKKHSVPVASLRKRLERWRCAHDAGYFEVSNPRPNAPRFLYDEEAVLPVIRDLQGGRKRPANVQRQKS